MHDVKNTINGLQQAIDIMRRIMPNQYWFDIETPCNDAIALLKAQEPVEATVCNNDVSGAGSWWYQCGKCRMPIDPKDRFCRYCGQAVKWK